MNKKSRNAAVPDLDLIEFDGSEAVAEFARVARSHGRALALQMEAAADELGEVLAHVHRADGHPLAFGFDVKWRARQVARRLERMAELAGGFAVEAVKLNAEYRKQFAELVSPEPEPRKRSWEW